MGRPIHSHAYVYLHILSESSGVNKKFLKQLISKGPFKGLLPNWLFGRYQILA